MNFPSLDFMFYSEKTYLQFALRYLPAVITSHFCWWSNLAASGYCIQIEMNLDPLGLGVLPLIFKFSFLKTKRFIFVVLPQRQLAAHWGSPPHFYLPGQLALPLFRLRQSNCIYYSLIGGAWIIFFELRQSNCIIYNTVWLAEPE